MALYCIGDLQGCNAPLQTLLHTIDFSPSRDTLYFLGDLVNRGPDSAGVLRRLMQMDGAARCVLGNHDLHLLAVANGVRRVHRGDTVGSILNAPDREAMLDWLRRQHMAIFEHGHLMVHAGVLPQWTAAQAMQLAAEVEAVLTGPDLPAFLTRMYGNEPAAWNDSLEGADRLRVIVNAFTRLRFCTADGTMEFTVKEGAAKAPEGYLAWYDVPARRTQDVTVAFGHWSTLGLLLRPNLLSLDTGCVWGGSLSAARLGPDPQQREIIAVPCAQCAVPG